MVGGIITIAKGHDASYPWRQIGTASGERGADTAGRGIGQYYLSPAEKGGEPPGVWTGKGGAELGLIPGTIVDRAVFEPLYGQHLDPRDPIGLTRLGRAPGQFQSAEAIYEAMLLAEPQATAERRAELMIEAKSKVRTPDLYWDATFSVSKSISLFHASALVNAAAAADRGDVEEADRWEEVAAGIWEAIMEGTAAALDYLQREAGQSRAGYHPGGRWEDAREWVIASFRQHTSRDGDPQLHVHNLILHKVRRESDGEWRALDSMSLYRQRPAASAIAALVAENALTTRFGVQWVPRKDGHGREIADVDQALMDMFSSRRHSINPVTARLAEAYQAQFGRAPDARALTSIRQWANHMTRRAKVAEPLDMESLVRRWAAQACASESGALEPLAPAVMGEVPDGADPAPSGARSVPAWAGVLSEAQVQRLAEEAVASVQAAQSAWTKADLIRHLGERLPAQSGAIHLVQATALLPELAQRALTTEAVMLAAPEWPRVPDCLRRASGESLYVPHGAERYATGGQLALEDRMVAHARETGAPRLEPAQAAQLLGADEARLAALLNDPAPDADVTEDQTGSGLRADQAAAAYLVLTSARRVDVLAGPAGSGKTTTVAEMARMWREAGMGPVIGLATSQSAANVLAEAGIADAFNTARFLGHVEGQRAALGPQPVAAGSLLILDEASMMSLADVAAILALARERGCKVVVTGDHCQLAAVEGGGAMGLLARRLGFVQLAEPQRFASAWERRATLGLRAGDKAVLRDYEQHGRLRGGTPEEAAEQAYRGWLADYLDGKDTILIARTEDQVRELSRRARDDLVRYGLVDSQAELRLAAGQQAGIGDLVVARRNARFIVAGEAGRELANRDVLRITSVTSGTGGLRVEVCRLVGREPATGEARWSAAFPVSKRYLANHGSLAYAATQHSAIGRTTDTAHVLVDGLGDRQGLYVAMSRGREANYAYCVTEYARAADVRAGSRPDPELERSRRLKREQAGIPAGGRAESGGGRHRVDAVSVLAGVIARDGGELTATETLERELSGADSLAVLGAMWDDVTRGAQEARFEYALRGVLPGGLAEQALADPACIWLWRTLREAEAAGLDGADVLREGVAARNMNGVRDPARVLDSRVRRMLDGVQPQVPGAWRTRVPDTGSPDLDRYLAELAEAMDERTRRLGEHAAFMQPTWACTGLGPVPDDRVGRADWEERVGVVGAYRERYGYNDPADPIGPAPGKTSPGANAAWHAALAVLGAVNGQDLRGCTDGELWLHRSGYERETAWAPPYVAEELRLMRVVQRDAHVCAVRAEHESSAASDGAAVDRQLLLGHTWRALEAKAAGEADMFGSVQETRGKWQRLTQPILQLAIASDVELRRRHPGMRIEPLRPHPAEAARSVGGAEDPYQTRPVHGMPLNSAQHDALGLSSGAALAETPEQVLRIAENARRIRDRIDEIARLHEPDSSERLCDASVFAMPRQRERDAILHPPAHELVPSARIISEYQARPRAVAPQEPERG